MASLRVYAGHGDEEPLMVCQVPGTNFNVVVEDDDGNIVASSQYNVPSDDGDDN